MRGSSITFLWPYIARRRHWIVGCLFLAAVGGTASAFSPFVLGHAVDELKKGVRLDVIIFYAIGLLALSVTVAVFRYLLRMLTGNMAATVTYELGQEFFQKLLVLDQKNYAFFGRGDLLSRGTMDFIYIWRFFSAGFQMMLHSLVLLFVGVVLMASSSLPLAALVFISLALIMMVQIFNGPFLERSFDRVQHDVGRLSAFVQEHLGAVRMFKAYSQLREVVEAFEDVNRAYARSYTMFALRSGLFSPLPGLVVRLSAAVVLGVGGFMVIRNLLTLGELVQFVVYLNLLSNAAIQMSSAYERLQQGAAATARVAEVLRHEPHVKDLPEATEVNIKGSVAMRDVGVRAGGRWVLKDVNFEVPAGSTVGIVGPTGSGKSTLLSLIARVQDPDSGCVLVDDRDIRTIKLDSLRKAIALVPQQTFLFEMTIRENITIGLEKVTEEDLEYAVNTSRLVNDMPQFPNGLDTMVSEGGSSLSGGQRQRTSIARALVRKPKILLLDDAFASVDAHTATQIIQGLTRKDLTNGYRRTTFIVTQNLLAVRHADVILVLDNGRIVEQGTHEELVELGGLYANMYANQHRERSNRLDDAVSSADVQIEDTRREVKTAR